MQASEAKAVKAVKGLKETGLPAGYKTQSMDTTIDAERYLFHQWKSLTLIQKANQLVSWTKGCLELSLMGVKQRYPEASLSKLRYEFARVTLKSSFPDPIYHLIAEHSQRLMLIDPISLALDVVEEKVVRLLQFLQPRFYVSEDAVREAIQFQRSFNLIDNESFGKVDIFILKDEAFPQIEFQRRRSQLVRQNPDRSLVLPTPEDLILQKLIGYRMTENESQRQWRDVLGVLKLQGDRLDFEYLQKWAIELELRDLLATACVESGLEVIQNRSTTANTPRE